jgi:hypothetical protein
MSAPLIVRLLQDRARYQRSRDGRVPWRRDPLSLTLRLAYMVGRMGLSPHPGDLASWARSMATRRKPFAYVRPWLTFEAVRAVDAHLQRGSRLFEYGCGHSTVYWARRGVEVWGMESDPAWYARTREQLRGTPNADIRLACDEQAYVRGIDRVQGDFDAVLIDGDWRRACLAAALPRLRPGGMLVVDNTDWHWYADIDVRIPRDWRKVVHAGCAPFIGYPSETSIWTRPSA